MPSDGGGPSRKPIPSISDAELVARSAELRQEVARLRAEYVAAVARAMAALEQSRALRTEVAELVQAEDAKTAED